jgi:hypothetical protein
MATPNHATEVGRRTWLPPITPRRWAGGHGYPQSRHGGGQADMATPNHASHTHAQEAMCAMPARLSMGGGERQRSTVPTASCASCHQRPQRNARNATPPTPATPATPATVSTLAVPRQTQTCGSQRFVSLGRHRRVGRVTTVCRLLADRQNVSVQCFSTYRKIPPSCVIALVDEAPGSPSRIK